MRTFVVCCMVMSKMATCLFHVAANLFKATHVTQRAKLCKDLLIC